MRGLGEDETRKGREGGRKMSNERRMGKRGGKEWDLGGRDEEVARRNKEGGGWEEEWKVHREGRGNK